MNYSNVSPQASSLLLQKISEYLGKKFHFSSVEPYLKTALEQHIGYFNAAISHYNTERRNDFEQEYPWIWCVNAQETDIIMYTQLPQFEEALMQLASDLELANQVFKNIRDNSSLIKIWTLKDLALADNILLLIYRTTVIFLNKSRLFHSASGTALVQISSTVEEMIFCQKIIEEQTPLFDSFKHWLKEWKEEGFAEELYLALKDQPKEY